RDSFVHQFAALAGDCPAVQIDVLHALSIIKDGGIDLPSLELVGPSQRTVPLEKQSWQRLHGLGNLLKGAAQWLPLSTINIGSKGKKGSHSVTNERILRGKEIFKGLSTRNSLTAAIFVLEYSALGSRPQSRPLRPVLPLDESEGR